MSLLTPQGNAFVAGAAKSGLGVAKLLKKQKIPVFVSDANAIAEPIKKELVDLEIPFEEKGHSLEKFDGECDFLVTSPGIPLHQGLAQRAFAKRISVLSEIEVVSWFLPDIAKVIAITGTNGKSTVTNYMGQLFSRAGFKAASCGNIGIPFSQALLDFPSTEIYALELSSYQIETTWSLRPKASVFLNIQPDHLARYENVDEYFKAKWRLVLLTANTGVAVIAQECLEKAVKMGLAFPSCRLIVITEKEYSYPKSTFLSNVAYNKSLPLSFYHDLKNISVFDLPTMSRLETASIAHYTNEGFQVVFHLHGKKEILEIKSPCIPGLHNAANLLACALVAEHFGITKEQIKAQWEKETSTYQHLEHRLEIVTPAKKQGRNPLFINDSKATNIQSVLVALKSFSQPIRLLLGGEPKGESFSEIASFFNENLVKVYPFGKAALQIVEDLKNSKNNVADPKKSLLEAAELAYQESSSSEILLLSPGCASFDEFKNFEERGKIFKTWVQTKI